MYFVNQCWQLAASLGKCTHICLQSVTLTTVHKMTVWFAGNLEAEKAALQPWNEKRDSNSRRISTEWRISDSTWSGAEACIRSCLRGCHKIGLRLWEGRRRGREWTQRHGTEGRADAACALLLTVHPANAKRLQDGKEQKRHPTAGVVVKQLEDVESTLCRRQEGCELAASGASGNFATTLDLTSVTMTRPMKKQRTLMARSRILRRWPTWKKDGFKSEIAVVRASKPTN